jgi:hypothetical protein
MEHWNTGMLRKIGILPIKNIKMNLYFKKLIAFLNPSFHHSIIPLFPLDYSPI